jgi:hypothetical protein
MHDPGNTFPLEGDTWDISRALWRTPAERSDTRDGELGRLKTELELRDLQARYFDALDSGDLDAVMSFFHEDCELVGARGTFVGKDAIRGDYELVLSQSQARLHMTANVSVRLLDSDEAWMSSRNYGVLRRLDNQLLGVSAVLVERLVKTDRWLYRQRRVTPMFSCALTEQPFDLSAAAPDTPTR